MIEPTGLPPLTRRSMLAGMASLSVAGAWPGILKAGTADSIDVHHHVFPPAFLAAARSGSVSPAVIEQWTLERTLAEMDKNGVATSIVSITQPGVWFGDVERSRALSRECNEYMARLKADHQGRFGFFAAVALPDVDGALNEIAHALDVLKADGIGLMTSYGNKWPGDPAFSLVFDELNRRKALVYFHPTGAECCRQLMPQVTPNIIEYPHDTARAITSLLFSGTLSMQRDIRFLFSHAGGTLPMLAGRIEQLASAKDKAEKMPKGLKFELSRLFYEMANSANRSSFAALSNLVPTGQIMLGSDYPYVPIGVTNEGLDTLGLSKGTLRAIRRDNALRMLKG